MIEYYDIDKYPKKLIEKTRGIYRDFQYYVYWEDIYADIPTAIIIEKYLGLNSTVTIPQEIKKLPVWKIGDNAFRNNEKIKTVNLPPSITKLGSNAFNGCINLEKINIGIGIKEIKRNAFIKCEKLEKNIREIIKERQNNSNIYEVINKSGIVTIEIIGYRVKKNVLGNISSQDTIWVIPDKIGGYPVTLIDIWDSTHFPVEFNKISIPASVTGEINIRCLYKLVEIIVHKDNPVYCDIEGSLYDKKGKILFHCPADKTGIFYIPGSLTNIKNIAFDRYSGISKFDTSANKNFSVKNGMLLSRKGTSLIKCPAGMRGICNIPAGVKIIEDNAFYQCRKLTSVNFPESVTLIKENAFYECSFIKSMNFPGNLKKIDPNILIETYIENFIIPGNFKCINNWAYAHNYKLKKVVFEEGIVEIGAGAFSSCDQLKTVKLPKSLKSIGYGAFHNTRNLSKISKRIIKQFVLNQIKKEKIDIFKINFFEAKKDEQFGPLDKYDSVLEISEYTGKEAKVIIPSKIMGVNKIIIGFGAFNNCGFIKEIIFPKSVIGIKKHALADCTGLSEKCRASIIERFGKNVFTRPKKPKITALREV